MVEGSRPLVHGRWFEASVAAGAGAAVGCMEHGPGDGERGAAEFTHDPAPQVHGSEFVILVSTIGKRKT